MHTMDKILYAVDSVTYAANDWIHDPVVEEIGTIVLVPLGVVFCALLVAGFAWAFELWVGGIYNKFFNNEAPAAVQDVQIEDKVEDTPEWLQALQSFDAIYQWKAWLWNLVLI